MGRVGKRCLHTYVTYSDQLNCPPPLTDKFYNNDNEDTYQPQHCRDGQLCVEPEEARRDHICQRNLLAGGYGKYPSRVRDPERTASASQDEAAPYSDVVPPARPRTDGARRTGCCPGMAAPHGELWLLLRPIHRCVITTKTTRTRTFIWSSIRRLPTAVRSRPLISASMRRWHRWR